MIVDNHLYNMGVYIIGVNVTTSRSFVDYLALERAQSV